MKDSGQRIGVSALGRAAMTGVLATLTMDAAMLAAALMGGEAFDSERLSPEIIGRWAAGLVRGQRGHDEISREEPIRGELALGMATHYATGIILTEGFCLAAGPSANRMSRAVGYGLATSVFPLLLMFPSMGYGWAGTSTGEAARMTRTMLLGHLAFGAGIGIWSRVLATGNRPAASR